MLLGHFIIRGTQILIFGTTLFFICLNDSIEFSKMIGENLTKFGLVVFEFRGKTILTTKWLK